MPDFLRKNLFTASKYRIVLSVLMLLVIACGIAGFLFAYKFIGDYALEVSKKSIDAEASRNTLSSLEKVEKELEKNRVVVQRAADIVAESSSYKYQNQVIGDLRDYAQRSGVTITSLDFAATGPKSTTTPQVSPITGAPTGATTNSQSAPPSGLKSTTVTITLQTPVRYRNLLNFIYYLEQNLTKMQISKLELSKPTAGSRAGSDTVNINAFTVEVYLR